MKKLSRVVVMVLLAPLFWVDLEAGAQTGSRELILTVFDSGRFAGQLSFSTTIQILNLTDATATVNLAAFTNGGDPMSDLTFLSNAGTGSELSLGAQESAFVVVQGEAGEFVEGWVRLTYEGATSLRASSEIRLSEEAESSPGGNRVLTSVQVPGMAPAGTVFAFPHVELFRGHQVVRTSGYALVNPSADQVAHVTFTLLDTTTEGGQTLTTSLEIPPRQKRSVLVNDLIPGLLPQISIEPPELLDLTGSLRIEADSPVAVGGIDLLSPSGALITGLVTQD